MRVVGIAWDLGVQIVELLETVSAYGKAGILVEKLAGMTVVAPQ